MPSTVYRWTNPSARLIARSGDPIESVVEATRALVFRALEAGWQGPPFDPLWLANFAGIRVLAREDILDARTIPATGGKFLIEFNPNRPRPRINYSICHEIAHTFFPDCADRVRNRVSHSEVKGDDWQLEMLCNIAAAELLMPIGSFPADQDLRSIDQVLDLRRQFEASVDAVLLRAVNLVPDACFVFSASPRSVGRETRYFIDYARPSRSWRTKVGSGYALPKNTVVSECTAIGYTAKGKEQWTGVPGKLDVQCVGLPPYPNEAIPRVAGIVFGESHTPAPAAITYLSGDATSPRGEGLKVIAQVVSDKALTWGAGFALAARKKWPRAQENFRKWALTGRSNLRLGSVHKTEACPGVLLISMVAQHGYGPSATPRIRYGALESTLTQLADIAAENGATVHMPRIGSGQAGGSWPIVQELIDEKLIRRGVEVFVYDLPGGARTTLQPHLFGGEA